MKQRDFGTHTCRKGCSDEVTTPTIRKHVEFCIHILSLQNFLEDIDAAILKNQPFPSSLDVIEIQALEYTRLYHSVVCFLLKLRQLL